MAAYTQRYFCKESKSNSRILPRNSFLFMKIRVGTNQIIQSPDSHTNFHQMKKLVLLATDSAWIGDLRQVLCISELQLQLRQTVLFEQAGGQEFWPLSNHQIHCVFRHGV